MVSAQNLLGQTSLHLAADWPWACEALLKAGADLSITDLHEYLPLSYACFQNCLESVQILLAANSPLSRSYYGLSVMKVAFDTVDNKMIHMALINELASRRKRLLTNSQALLPRHIFEELTSSLKGLPDIEAFFLIRALLEAGDNIDPHHWCYTSSSVYDYEKITPEIAELFFEAGFTDLEGKDSYGLTVPLRTAMQAYRPKHGTVMLAKLHWLLSKSDSLRSPIKKESLSEWLIPSVNVISAMLGPLIASQKPRIDLQPPIDSEEARELQEEDEHRMQRFHNLLPEAELEYQAWTSFSDFWAKFYHDNIASSQEDESLEIRAQAAEIGVRIHEIDGVESLEED
ncbi:MAG: hypothetical protein Q9197_001140 [Variospora fuerteventurae]